MDILATQLQSMVKEAPLEECRKAIQKMPFQQAVEYIKNMYSKESIRKQNIESLKEAFPEKNDKDIIKALDSANNDFESAFEILLNNPASIDENKKSGLIPKANKIQMRKRKSPSPLFISNKSKDITPPITKKDPPSIPNTNHPAISSNKPKSWILSHDPIIRSSKTSQSSILPRMEIPLSQVQSSWNKISKSPFIYVNNPFSILRAAQSKKDNSNVSRQNDIPPEDLVYVDAESDYSNDSDAIEINGNNTRYYYEEEEEEEEVFDDSQESPNILKTKRIDLHGYVKDDARFIVEDAIIHSKQKKIGVFHFITGIGHHSDNNVPILRPMVLEICQKYNVHAYIPEKNQGVVVCNVCKPYSD